MFLLLLGQLGLVHAALPKCASGVTCPPGGLWSEWTISGSPTCSTSCGSCSTLFYERSCLTARANCDCTGPSTRYVPCNTETCKYPAQRTCCIPYVPMLIEGKMQCGPIPKETTTGSGPCCPSSGLWSQWSKFSFDSTTSTYKRSRECSSTSSGCNCIGNDVEEQTQCPCPRTVKDAADECSSVPVIEANVVMKNFWPLKIDDKTCTATLELESSNDSGRKMCHRQLPFDYTAALVLQMPDIETRTEKCKTDRPFDCEARAHVATNERQTVSFSCDLETLYWRYDYTGWLIEGYNQPSYK